MVTRTFQIDDGKANATVTVEGRPNHRVWVTIDGKKVELGAEHGTAPMDAAPSVGNGRADGATAVSVEVMAASTFSATAASVQASSSIKGARNRASNGLFVNLRRNRR